MQTEQSIFVSLPQAIALHGKNTPRRLCVKMGERELTYGDVRRFASALAMKLNSLGVGTGHRVGILMENDTRFVPIMVGTWLSGCALVPFSNMLSTDSLGTLISDADLSVIFCSPDCKALLDSALTSLQSRPLPLVISTADLQFGEDEESELPIAAASSDDPCSLLYSSGTTGIPKGILHSHRGRLMFALGLAAELSISRQSVVLLTTPMYSNGTWLMLLPALLMGAQVHIMERFTPDGFIDMCDSHEISHSFVVPLQCAVTLSSKRFAGPCLQSLRGLVCGGAPLAKPVKVQWLAKIGGQFVELYGLTEGFGTLVRPGLELDPFGCGVGPAMAGTDLRVIGDDETVLEAGQAGEIVGRSAVLLSEYFRKPEQNLACQWVDEKGNEFFRSGDIGYLDDNGFLHVVDRKKDMIISGGFNVFPADIEAVFLSHPAVADVAVIGAFDEKWGETPLALVIRRPGHEEDENSLLEWLNPRLGKTQRVSQVRFVLDFPRNPLGKVLKRELRVQWNSATGQPANGRSVEGR